MVCFAGMYSFQTAVRRQKRSKEVVGMGDSDIRHGVFLKEHNTQQSGHMGQNISN